jgi:Ca-activated chloride channel family protein
MLSFTNPLWFLLLLALPLYYALRKSGALRGIEFPLTLGDWNGLPFRWASPAMRAVGAVSVVSGVLGFMCVVVALAGPVLFREEPVYSGTGTGIVFVLDVSPSMAARDIGTETRLDAARRFIRACLKERPGDSFGLVALGSEAALLVPPTTDHRVFAERLDSLAIGEMGDGTALGLGIAVAAAHLAKRDRGHSFVILVTDGENNTGEINPKTAAAILPDYGIRLYVVGVGTRGEVPLDYTDPASGKHYSGVLNSEYNENELREIARRADGVYVSAGSVETLASVFADIGKSVPVSPSSWTRTVEESVENPVILIALALFAFAWTLRRLVMRAVV